MVKEGMIRLIQSIEKEVNEGKGVAYNFVEIGF
jgi:hypothetical protein